mmetsp:Transcript_48093/g.137364  ORF Transcript_48093/g.137364 Transcript_48093/m.137364 type:complete len:260 (+) Transcript_48093:736-1515(+)
MPSAHVFRRKWGKAPRTCGSASAASRSCHRFSRAAQTRGIRVEMKRSMVIMRKGRPRHKRSATSARCAKPMYPSSAVRTSRAVPCRAKLSTLRSHTKIHESPKWASHTTPKPILYWRHTATMSLYFFWSPPGMDITDAPPATRASPGQKPLVVTDAWPWPATPTSESSTSPRCIWPRSSSASPFWNGEMLRTPLSASVLQRSRTRYWRGLSSPYTTCPFHTSAIRSVGSVMPFGGRVVATSWNSLALVHVYERLSTIPC